MKQQLGALAVAAAVAATLPAVASAHPSVYESSAKTFTGTPPALGTVARYVVSNHGFTQVYTESNQQPGKGGVVGFNLVPGGAYRATKDTAAILDEGGTPVQAHATCLGGTSDLGSVAKVAAWQGGVQAAPTTQQPFYNYVPFQTTSAGLEDDPAVWIPTLLAAGFNTADFTTAASAQAACVAKGGTYYAADTLTTTSASLSAGLVEPLEEEIDELTDANATLTERNKTLTDENTALKDQGSTTVSANTSLNSQVASLTASLAGTQAALDAAKGQISSLLLAATPIKLAVGSTKARTVAASGQTVGVTAAPLKAVTVTLSVSEAQAAKLKLASSVLGKQTATTAADGTASVTVKVSKAAAKALKGLKGSLSTTVEATSGDRFATTTSRLTR